MIKIWLGLLVFVVVVILLKMYLAAGIHQVSQSVALKNGYRFFSIATFLMGIIAMAVLFPKGIKDMTVTSNFVIAFMVSLLLCELILALFFVIGDVQLWLKQWHEGAAQKMAEIPQGEGRRNFIKTVGLAACSLPFASFMYGITKGKYNFKVVTQTLYFTDLPPAFDGFRIVQFSDLHAGGFDSYEDVKRGFDLIQEQNPDLILFTGDLVNDIAEEILPYLPLLTELKAPYGKYSVLGNHDYSEDDGLFPTEEEKLKNANAIQDYQREAGFVVLNNANVKIEKSNAYIRLIGVENWGNGFIKKGNLDMAVTNCPHNEFSILMSHDPTHWERVVRYHSKNIQLTLSGHTHGMQMGIEAWGLKWSPMQYFYTYWAGLYNEVNRFLYVNRGFGFMAFAGRVGVFPEITTFVLKTKNGNE